MSKILYLDGAAGRKSDRLALQMPDSDQAWSTLVATASRSVGGNRALADRLTAMTGALTTAILVEAYQSGRPIAAPGLKSALLEIVATGGGASTSAPSLSFTTSDSFDRLQRGDHGVLAEGIAESEVRTVRPLDRRHFLQLLGLSLAAPDPDQWERLEKAIRRSAAVDTVLISDLEAQTSSLHQLERQIPARQLSARVELHLDRLTDLLERAPAGLKRRLIATVGDTASLGGWIAWDMGNRESVARLYKIATLAAREGDDPVLRACLLAYASYGAPPDLARELLQSARSCVDGGAYPTTLAWIDGREAEEAALTGDAVAAARLLEHGFRMYEASQPAQERTWTRFVDSTRMAGFAISTYTRLGMTESALQAATNVLGGLESGKRRAIFLADTADVYLQQQGVEAAEAGLKLADQALEAARETESTLGYDHLKRLSPRLKPWLRLPAARQLHDQLLQL